MTVQAKKGEATDVASGVAVKSNRVLASPTWSRARPPSPCSTRDERNYEAKVMGSDPDTDLALLDVDAADLTVSRARR